MDKKKRAVAARSSSPKPTPGAKSPARGRSKSRGRQTAKKEVKKTQPRSKSRSRKDKSKGRERSRSPKPRSRSQSARSSSRSRAAKSKKEASMKDFLLAEKKLNLVLKDVMHEDYSKDSTLNEIIRRSMSRDISQEKVGTLRRSSRISTAAATRENEASKKIDGLSQNIISKAKATAKARIPTLRSKLISTFGSLIVLALPVAFTLLLHLSCTRDQCTLSKFHIPRNWRVYLNLEAAEIVLGFTLLQAILLLLPIGRIAQGPVGRNGSLTYRCNGLLSSVLTIAMVGGLWYYKFPVTIVYEKLLPLIVASGGLGYLLAIVLFIKGGRAPVPGLNPAAVSGNRLHQFVVGREVNPIFFNKLNVKIWIMRVAFNGLTVLHGLLALKAYEVRNEWSPTLLTCIGLCALYIWDFYWFEDSFSSMFEAQEEGFGGYLSAGFFIYPFLPTLTTKYIIQHRVELPIYGLAAIGFFFIVGFVVYRASNLQKAAFRKNPLNPALAHFETIPTSRGKKLLVSGWWGWVRHPNYFGDIILHWAWASTAGYAHAIPYLFPLLTSLVLIHRAKRVDDHCSQKYQSAWQEYCSRVRYRLLPRVY